jgi:hypothetical protein
VIRNSDSFARAVLLALALGVPLSAQEKGAPDVRVWVNTNTHVYRCSGTTKTGEYMTQAEAQKRGNRPARGKACQQSKVAQKAGA